MTARAIFRTVLLTPILCLIAIAPLAHEGHDHDEPPPLNLPVAPRVIAVTPELELVGVLSSSDRLTIFLHAFATNEPVTGAKLTVSADTDGIDAKPEGPGIFSVTAPWIRKGRSVDLIFALKLSDGGEDLLTGRLEVPQTLDAAMRSNATDKNWLVRLFTQREVLWLVLSSFLAGSLITLLARRRTTTNRSPNNQDYTAEATAQNHNDAEWSAPQRKQSNVAQKVANAVILLTLLQATSGKSLNAAEVSEDAVPSVPSTMATDRPQRMPDASLFVPKATQHLLSIRTQIAKPTRAAKTVTLSGRITVGPKNLGRVQSTRPGRFQAAGDRVGYVGMEVTAGDVLGYVETYIEAADRANIVSQIAETEARIEKNKKILARFEKAKGAVPPVKIDEARGELEALTERRKELLPSLASREPLIAPISGVISKASVVVGQVVEQRDILYEIIDPSELWVEAVTTHPEIVNNLASAVVTVHDHHILDLEYLGRGLALRNHASLLNFKILNSQQEEIAVGMTAKIVLHLQDQQDGIVLPASALVRGASGLPIVWIKTAPERFEPQTVKAQSFDGDSIVITAGLKAEQRVVTEGVTLLNQVR